MTFADPSKDSFLCVRLEFGGSELPNPDVILIDDTPTVIRLTNTTSDQTVDGELYSSAPELEVNLTPNVGDLDERPTDIEVLRSYIPDEMTKGLFAPVSVKILEAVTGNLGDEFTTLFAGRLYQTTRNSGGKRGVDMLRCFGLKKDLDVPCGVPEDHQCFNALFGRGCRTEGLNSSLPGQGPLLEEHISACDLVSADGAVVEIEDLLEFTGRGDIWQAGFLEYRGLRIKIRDWAEADQTPVGGSRVDTPMTLVRPPPASWIGQRVRAVTGCSKTMERCDESYGNLPNFNGVGWGILPYNPNVESPS